MLDTVASAYPTEAEHQTALHQRLLPLLFLADETNRKRTPLFKERAEHTPAQQLAPDDVSDCQERP